MTTRPVTAAPGIRFEGDKLHLSCDSEGASIGYRLEGQRWRLYTQPLSLPPGTAFEAKAVRYGWEESVPVSGVAPE